MTVEVETPEGLRTGSSVWSWTVFKPTVPLVSSYGGKFRADAVSVELPDGRQLFALIKDQQMIPERQFRDLPSVRSKEDRVADVREIASRIGEVRRLPCLAPEEATTLFDSDCPYLVGFSDPSDPNTMFAVQPSDAASFLGDGYSIRAIYATITNEPTSNNVTKALPWLESVGRRRSTVIDLPHWDRKGDAPTYSRLELVAPSDFSTELYE